MSKSFPESYPYSNEHGIEFTAEDMRLYSEQLFEKFKPRSHHFGVEMAGLLIWLINNAKYKDKADHLLSVIFSRIVRRSTFDEASRRLNHKEVDEQLIDPSVINDFQMLEGRIMFSQLAGDDIELDDLIKEDRRKRTRIIARLKNRLKEREALDEH